jgi:hypothetical protein
VGHCRVGREAAGLEDVAVEQGEVGAPADADRSGVVVVEVGAAGVTAQTAAVSEICWSGSSGCTCRVAGSIRRIATSICCSGSAVVTPPSLPIASVAPDRYRSPKGKGALFTRR